MSLIDKLFEKNSWERFFRYKSGIRCSKRFTRELRAFIDSEAYLTYEKEIRSCGGLPLPAKSVISKMSSQKKRTVYKYPYDFNMVLKLLTYLTLRKYDQIYTPCLYSFRPGICAKDAIASITRNRDLHSLYSYKVDVSDYFNSIPVDKICAVLDDTVKDDEELLRFMKTLLTEEKVMDGSDIITEKKGIMAGTPIASFYADIYLKDLDEWFFKRGILYARYSDDIIVFAKDEDEINVYRKVILDHLDAKDLTVNPDKESFSRPGDGFCFLGIEVKDGQIDIAPASVKKLKQKMRRKARALDRWRRREGLDGTKAAAAFIRIFNHKLLEENEDSDLTWSLWFFPVITTPKSLHEVDLYSQELLRFLISGTHTKSRFNVRYDDLKALGYKSLVNEYYKHHERN
ncbi:reverse transcriptase domain-containing protein [Butyrivibrio sp. AE2032]|uniref:reverse transcriptase domain-containing protein n=1 Tax=Butyrivibrio sp. AE2032 TaxID=1458463 RepID=UPI000550935D|nr:reverse transcriptase domain-containing protein [Butyrivibrio sp. AE2032]